MQLEKIEEEFLITEVDYTYVFCLFVELTLIVGIWDFNFAKAVGCYRSSPCLVLGSPASWWPFLEDVEVFLALQNIGYDPGISLAWAL